jgi:hypothetical protein
MAREYVSNYCEVERMAHENADFFKLLDELNTDNLVSQLLIEYGIYKEAARNKTISQQSIDRQHQRAIWVERSLRQRICENEKVQNRNAS